MMAAEKVMQGQPLEVLLEGFVDLPLIEKCPVSGLQLDSRKVISGDLFIACSGEQVHGLRFAAQAIECGASAIVYDPSGDGEFLAKAFKSKLPLISVDGLSQKLGIIASRFYGKPSEQLRVIGVTGTNGKTSCTNFLAQALVGELSCGTIGTLGWGIRDDWHQTTHTTPDAVELNRVMSVLRAEGAEAVALEVSSHGLVQGRTVGTCFEGALYTNFSRDHLDYHGSLSDYVEAKLLLLKNKHLSFVALNLDDNNATRVLNAVPEGVVIWGYSQLPNPEYGKRCAHVVVASEQGAEKGGLKFKVTYQEQSLSLQVPLIGLFNIENSLAVLTVLLAMGIQFERAIRALHQLRPIAGRMERISIEDRPLVVVDYAHTPDALEKALTSLRPHCAGHLKVLFGCGGDRDRGKRSLMGQIAEKQADVVYLTDDNPRSEDGNEIIADICSSGLSHAVVVRDRKQAIARVIADSSVNDVILVAGKGHETSQQIGDLSLSFDDREVVRDCLKVGGLL